MVEVIDEDSALRQDPKGVHKVPFLVKTGIGDERAIELELGVSVISMLNSIAIEQGCGVEELKLFREGQDEPLTSVDLIDADYPRHRRHHVHHMGEVKVTVYYQADSRHRDFMRRATIEDVLSWAIGAFSVDPSMATEFELVRHGQKEELPGTEHVGHLAGRHRELALDLVRGDIANGS